MALYLLGLKPLGSFFFGGEVTFGDGENINYLVKSNFFPQQTTILGMLRKEMLIQKGYLGMTDKGEVLKANKKEIEMLIGPESFDINKKDQDFGVINKISPVFLYKSDYSWKKSFFSVAPKDFGLEFVKAPGRACFNMNQKEHVPFMKNYEQKTGLAGFFINGACEKIPLDSMFMPVERIGITKGDKGTTEEKGLYKQTAYRLKEGFVFACIADLDFSLQNSLVFMGGEKSAFKLSLHDCDKTFEDIFAAAHDDKRAVLLSDAYMKAEIYDYCDFAVTETMDFRNIKTSTGNYRFAKGKSKHKHTFLKRGSVLYPGPKGMNEIKRLTANKNLNKIGYNIIG